MKRYESVDAYIEGATHWQAELVRLRAILLRVGLRESLKWGSPCYLAHGKNVVGMAAFKSYVGLWFFQGALLSDPDRVLINAQEGKTKAMRQWRFTSADPIQPRRIAAYLREAKRLAEGKMEIKPERRRPVVVPEALQNALNRRRRAAAAFHQLSRGRQREFAEYIAEAKRSETRDRRLQKIIPMIEAGCGLNDKYRSC